MIEVPQKRSPELEDSEQTCNKAAKLEDDTTDSSNESFSPQSSASLEMLTDDDIDIEGDLDQEKQITNNKLENKDSENETSAGICTNAQEQEDIYRSDEKRPKENSKEEDIEAKTNNNDISKDGPEEIPTENFFQKKTENFEESESIGERKTEAHDKTDIVRHDREEVFEEIDIEKEKRNISEMANGLEGEKNNTADQANVVDYRELETVNGEKIQENTTVDTEKSMETLDDRLTTVSNSESEGLFLESYRTYSEHLNEGFIPENENEHRLLLIGHTPTQIELLRSLNRMKGKHSKSQEHPKDSLPLIAKEDQSDLGVAARAAIEATNYNENAQTSVNKLDIYSTLNADVDRMAQQQHYLEIEKALTYPRFYKYCNQLKVQVAENEEKHILSFKQILLKTGQISQYNPEAFSVPKKFDLLKNYFVTESNDDLYYRSKMTPDLNSDQLVNDLIGQTRIDIVISTCCLIKLAEMQSDLSTEGCIPLIVKQDGPQKILYFERPLPKEKLSAVDKNKIVYDAAFKSLCLDWSNRRSVSSHSIKHKVNEGWDYHSDENLQYTHWSFGDLSLLIQYQFDSEVANTEKRANLISKLEYKNNGSQKEITKASERVTNWLRSYIGGHSMVIEGSVDVANNSLMRIDKKKMVDIMGDWMPIRESEMLRQTFSYLHKKLEAGHYLLDHKPNDKCFIIYASADDGAFDLHKKYTEL